MFRETQETMHPVVLMFGHFLHIEALSFYNGHDTSLQSQGWLTYRFGNKDSVSLGVKEDRLAYSLRQ